MYGAKFIELWNYFAQRKISSNNTGYTNHGIVDWEPDINHTIYTDKYFMLRDTLSPRLKGLFGQKIKHLIPNFDLDSLGIVITSSNENVNYIKNISLISAPQDSTPIFDLGFFSDPVSPDPMGYEDRYFMLLKRYYPQSLGLQNFNISFNNMSPYTNWQISNFIDTAYYTITPDENGEFVSDFFQLFNGDAIFYRLAPVVKFGGKLVYSETVPDGTTLYDEMTIENGATLTVNGTYYAKANITVKSGGKIVAGTNGKIIFDSGKNIIIDGSAEIKGTSSNRLSISAAASYYGIVINPGSAFIMDYCDIESIGFAISTASGSQSYVNIANSNIVTMYSGISLASSSSYEVFQTPPVPIIQNCRITASFSGISVSNYRSVLLKSNTFSNCGISVSNVVSAYIQDNDISLGSHQNHPGILFNNSGGYIRNNIIKNRSNGIHIANSSPEIGGNLIENNYLHGLYIAGSSIPNLIGQLRTNPPAYYPLAGYNRIRNNGINTQPNSENDGS
ncbi:MAG TPA: right-handed parallel beta-helix repeat-containing protein [Ignavibacteriaceae bacterium]|nr:right-handed parallel beta-helix repeat-containing protein [Ignavibacteriaceae bacterium]